MTNTEKKYHHEQKTESEENVESELQVLRGFVEGRAYNDSCQVISMDKLSREEKMETILVETVAAVTTITINRPDKLNAINSTVLAEIGSVVDKITRDDEARVLIISGVGTKSFAAGADIEELHNCDSSSGIEFAKRGQMVFQKIESLQIPVVALVNGYALGGGCELALSCHIRFASSNARFALPEINLGVIPGYGGIARLKRTVGISMATEMILSGNTINADEALQTGLVSKVFSSVEELISKGREFAELLSSKPSCCIRENLKCLMSELPTTDSIEIEALAFGRICGTVDFKEGTSAFLEKRKGIFVGR